MRTVRLLISGLVQGVGFRYFTERTARVLGLCGYVRNLPDGRVETQASGPDEAIQSFIQTLRRGPVGAQVVDIVQSEAAPAEGSGFSIRYD